MPEHAAEEYRIFALNSNRPLLLGECYLIATAYNTFGPYWFGEQFLLLELPANRLEHAKFKVRPPTYGPADVSMVNAEFVFDGIKGLAKAGLAAILLKQFEATKNWEILATQFQFEPASDAVLTSCWIRKLYHAQLREAADTSETNKLPQLLNQLRALPVLEPR